MQTSIAQSPWHKLSRIVRADGWAGAIRHTRTVALHRAHAVLDRHLHAEGRRDATAAKVELDQVTIDSPNRGSGVHYLPTPWRVLDWLHAALPAPTPEWSFVDFGCGKGRVLLSAGQRPYGRVVGVEFATELARTAHSNLATMTGRRAQAIEVVEGDATQFALPETPLVVFLFNPFGSPVIEQVAANIERSYLDAPRPIVVAYLNPEHAHVFGRIGSLREAPLSPSITMKFGLLSPYRLKRFASAEALPLVLPAIAR